MTALRISEPKTARCFRKDHLKSSAEPKDWRAMVYAVACYEQHGACPYCQHLGLCTVRVARMSNGWQAQDVICATCLHLAPQRAGHAPVLLSPRDLAQGVQSADGMFDAALARFFPFDAPIVSKLSSARAEAADTRQLPLPCCAQN